MNGKAKGSRIEHKCIRLLEREGYHCTRAAGSLGAWDIIAIGPIVRLIQVKGGKRPYCAPAERELLRQFPAPASVSKELWYWKDRARTPVMVQMVKEGGQGGDPGGLDLDEADCGGAADRS